MATRKSRHTGKRLAERADRTRRSVFTTPSYPIFPILLRSHSDTRIESQDYSGREDSWGIGKDAYEKLTSKAKKQLRLVLRFTASFHRADVQGSSNKIGARRFRERRKDHIATLESRLAERDTLLLEMRNRLISSKQSMRQSESGPLSEAWPES